MQDWIWIRKVNSGGEMDVWWFGNIKVLSTTVEKIKTKHNKKNSDISSDKTQKLGSNHTIRTITILSWMIMVIAADIVY